MTESEWMNCPDTEAMHDWLGDGLGLRKLILYGCGCWRHAWGHRAGTEGLKIVQDIESFADGNVGLKRLRKVMPALRQAWYGPRDPGVSERDMHRDSTLEAAGLAESLLGPWWRSGIRSQTRQFLPSGAVRAALLREVVGNPFRKRTLTESWLTSAVRVMAEVIYAEQAFRDAPILADALEDAGCDDADILTHLRGPGHHTRGCWALDRILEKE
jgi:hypothetical protein